MVQHVPLLSNIFNVHQMDGGVEQILDFVDRAIGNLERDRRPSFRRTLNPFYWFGRLLESLADLPFLVLGRLGFNREKAEASMSGRFLKAAIYILGYLIGIVGSLFTIVEFMGWGQGVRGLLGIGQ